MTFPSVWQISSGRGIGSHAQVFLDHSIALMGPGDAGPWTPSRYLENGPALANLHRFAEEASPGDILLLKTGNETVSAIGIVASAYMYLEGFDDVNGQDLQHARRVRWAPLAAPHVFSDQDLGPHRTGFFRVLREEAIDFARRFLNSPPTDWQEAQLPTLPPEEQPLDRIPPELDAIVAEAADFVPLVRDVEAFGVWPSEDELIAHFVVPFLRALGWPLERIAVQWRRIDVAVFRGMPRSQENCHLVIEAKQLGAGVEGALEQARGYVHALGLPVDPVVTDGIRYRMYDSARNFEPKAYANLFRLKAPATRLFDLMRRP